MNDPVIEEDVEAGKAVAEGIDALLFSVILSKELGLPWRFPHLEEGEWRWGVEVEEDQKAQALLEAFEKAAFSKDLVEDVLMAVGHHIEANPILVGEGEDYLDCVTSAVGASYDPTNPESAVTKSVNVAVALIIPWMQHPAVSPNPAFH